MSVRLVLIRGSVLLRIIHYDLVKSLAWQRHLCRVAENKRPPVVKQEKAQRTEVNVSRRCWLRAAHPTNASVLPHSSAPARRCLRVWHAGGGTGEGSAALSPTCLSLP